MTRVKNTANIRQRIIGIVIIVALAVIFLPTLWQKNNGPKVKVRHIPARPALPQVKQIEAIPAIKWQHPAQPQGVAWSLSLGTFAKLSNAQSLLKRLRTSGYPAYMQRAQSDQGVVFKVYVGPELKQTKLQTAASKIQKTLHLKGAIIPFTAIPAIEKEN